MKQLDLFGSQEKKVSSVEQDKHHFTVFIDGASRNNPGPAGAGIYLLKDSDEFYKQGYYLGIKTNNQAEYLALLLGLFVIKNHIGPHDTVRIVSDSQLLVRQLLGEYRVKNVDLKPLHRLGRLMLDECGGHIAHVLRTENTQADRMANVGLDKKNPVPADFITFLRRHDISI
jgi:ribonuclease HI